MRRDKSTKRNQDYWNLIEKTAKEVSLWPLWMRGGSVDSENKQSVKAKSAEEMSQG